MELIDAIKTIRKECDKHPKCSGCQLRTYEGGCSITERTPEKWELKEDVDLNPRLFK